LKDMIIFDGAFGTYIKAKKPNLDFSETANITQPDLVLEIHKEYMISGINAIKTNTFAANSELYADFEMLKNIIKSGFSLANQAVKNTDVKVFADIGVIFNENAAQEYKQIADIFIECGASNFLFETLGEVASLQKTISYIKHKLPNSLVITSFAVGQDGYTKSAEYYKTLLHEATTYGADYVGLNCICGPTHMLNLIKKLPDNKYNLIAMPNAGYPTVENGRTVYIDNPEYYSEKLFEIYSCGVKAIGGCCGTTPEHIKQFVEKTKTTQKPKKITEAGIKISKKAVTKNHFSKANTVIALELSAPVDLDVSYILGAAKEAKECGVDFITIPDSPLGKARANSLIISSMIQRVTGVETIPHLSCRDKNQIAIKGDLLATNIEGISNILVITGDPIADIYKADAKNVFGFNSFKLIAFIKSLNDRVFCDNPYNIFAALNTSAQNFDSELKRAEEKLEKGANAFFTQPIFKAKDVENLRRAKEVLGSKILAGIMPLAGYKNALYMNNEVPGVEIPDEIIQNFKDKSAEEAKEISLTYAKSMAEQAKEICSGYYIMTALKKSDFSIELIKYIRGRQK